MPRDYNSYFSFAKMKPNFDPKLQDRASGYLISDDIMDRAFKRANQLYLNSKNAALEAIGGDDSEEGKKYKTQMTNHLRQLFLLQALKEIQMGEVTDFPNLKIPETYSPYFKDKATGLYDSDRIRDMTGLNERLWRLYEKARAKDVRSGLIDTLDATSLPYLDWGITPPKERESTAIEPGTVIPIGTSGYFYVAGGRGHSNGIFKLRKDKDSGQYFLYKQIKRNNSDNTLNRARLLKAPLETLKDYFIDDSAEEYDPIAVTFSSANPAAELERLDRRESEVNKGLEAAQSKESQFKSMVDQLAISPGMYIDMLMQEDPGKTYEEAEEEYAAYIKNIEDSVKKEQMTIRARQSDLSGIERNRSKFVNNKLEAAKEELADSLGHSSEFNEELMRENGASEEEIEAARKEYNDAAARTSAAEQGVKDAENDYSDITQLLSNEDKLATIKNILSGITNYRGRNKTFTGWDESKRETWLWDKIKNGISLDQAISTVKASVPRGVSPDTEAVKDYVLRLVNKFNGSVASGPDGYKIYAKRESIPFGQGYKFVNNGMNEATYKARRTPKPGMEAFDKETGEKVADWGNDFASYVNSNMHGKTEVYTVDPIRTKSGTISDWENGGGIAREQGGQGKHSFNKNIFGKKVEIATSPYGNTSDKAIKHTPIGKALSVVAHYTKNPSGYKRKFSEEEVDELRQAVREQGFPEDFQKQCFNIFDLVQRDEARQQKLDEQGTARKIANDKMAGYLREKGADPTSIAQSSRTQEEKDQIRERNRQERADRKLINSAAGTIARQAGEGKVSAANAAEAGRFAASVNSQYDVEDASRKVKNTLDRAWANTKAKNSIGKAEDEADAGNIKPSDAVVAGVTGEEYNPMEDDL